MEAAIKNDRVRSAILGLALLGPLALYASSVAPDLGAIDSGELAAVCTGLQVAHPTGYPLYTLLGRVATLLVPGTGPIARLNLLSGILTGCACLCCFLLFRSLGATVRPDAAPRSRDLLALGSTWLWSVHPALWSQAVGNEVHPLQALLVAALLLAAAGRPGLRVGFLTLYLFGLALTNHMTVLYLTPGLVAGSLLAGGSRSVRIPRLVLAGGSLFLLPLTLYLYLPIRSLADPLLDWGDPTNPERFFRHLSAFQYRIWLFASTEGFARNLAGFVREMAAPGNIPVLVCAAVGAAVLWKRDRPSLARLGLGLLVGTLWASGYEIHDLDPYYLIPRLCLAGLAVAGAARLLPTVPGRSGPRVARTVLLTVLPMVVAIVLAGSRWSERSRSGDRFIRLYAMSLLESLPERSILLTRHWDVVVSPVLYLQQVEGIRPDVTVVDTELLRRSWYFPQLRRTDPTLLEPVEDRARLLLEQLALFERKRPYDPREIEMRYRGLIAGLFEAHRRVRPFYHTPEVEPSFYGGWIGVPEALTVRMVIDPRLAPGAEPLDPKPWVREARHVRDPIRKNAWGFPIELTRSRIRFLEQFGREEEAGRWRASLTALTAVDLPGDR